MRCWGSTPLLATISIAVAMLAPLVQPVVADPSTDTVTEPSRRRTTLPLGPPVADSVEDSIVIDGYLDDAAWRTALQVELDFEWFPGDNVEPPVSTTAFMAYDSRYLYIAFRAEDPSPAMIRAHLMDRDEINTLIQDDHVVVLLDTFDDQRRSFQFRVNPLGVQADALFSEIDGIEDFSWDIIWQSAGRIDDHGYVIEMAIPFSQLRFPVIDGAQTWGVDFGRSYPRDKRHRIASTPRDRDNACTLCQLLAVRGFEGIRSGLDLEVAPTLTLARSDRAGAGASGALEDGAEEVDAGVSVRWGVTPSMTLNATVNPDFSQVEADAAQLDVNERFALFFPEQRPFFLEGADFFSTQVQALFTRTIVDPRWGLKLTGKLDGNAIGVFAAEDAVNTLLIPSLDGSRSASIEGRVLNSVLRYRRDVGEASTVGMLYTGRHGDSGYRNQVVGGDAFLRFGERSQLLIQGLFSDTTYPDQLAADLGQPDGDFSGHVYEALYFFTDRDWQGSLGYRDFSDGFRADSGFVTRVGFSTWRGALTRSIWGQPESWFTRVDLGGVAIHTRDQEGRLRDQRLDLFTAYTGGKQSQVRITGILQDDTAFGELFEDLFRTSLSASIQPSGHLRLAIEAVVGEVIDFANLRSADTVLIAPSAELKLGRRVNAQLDYLARRLEVDSGRLFDARLSELQLVYQHDIRTFVRAIFQHSDIDYQPEQYLVDPPLDREELLAQLLFSYKINPQTVAFVGYSDTRRGVEGGSLERSNRSLFIKIGYAFLR